jgi:hypothetical protein
MLAPGGRPGLKTKAAETGVLCRWAADFCSPGRPGEKLDQGQNLAAAGECLVEYVQILRDSPFVLKWETCNRLMFLCLKHLSHMKDIGQDFMPKAHMFVHLTQRAARCGNPRMYSCFCDETLNLVIAGMAASSHRANWENGIFQRVRLLPVVQKESSFAAFT